MTLPNFNVSGALPVVLDDDNPQLGGSLHTCNLAEFVTRFAVSERRIEILHGFLRHRIELWERDVYGLQWVSGSFVENLDRDPNDIDVVTFTELQELPPGDERRLFGGPSSKAAYDMDSYLVHTGVACSCADLLAQGTYWYELWTRRRAPVGSRKGFVWLTLNEDPADAILTLKALEYLRNA